VTQRGSTVASGGNMSISATGDGANSNIIIAGSEINAKGNLVLKADNDINLIAAQNTDEQHSERSSSSWGVGVTAQFGTKTQFGFTANAAGSETSVTHSGVSGAAVTITDAQAQQAKTGQSPDQAVASLDTSVRTGKDSSNSLSRLLLQLWCRCGQQGRAQIRHGHYAARCSRGG
jgi:filamentous hemagglutinin